MFECGFPFGLVSFAKKNFCLNCLLCCCPLFCGQDNLLGGQFWAMGRLNLLGGQINLLGGPTQLTCYLPPWLTEGCQNFSNWRVSIDPLKQTMQDIIVQYASTTLQSTWPQHTLQVITNHCGQNTKPVQLGPQQGALTGWLKLYQPSHPLPTHYKHMQ